MSRKLIQICLVLLVPSILILPVFSHLDLSYWLPDSLLDLSWLPDSFRRQKKDVGLITVEEVILQLAFLENQEEPWEVNGCDLSTECSLEDIGDSRNCDNAIFGNIPNETSWKHMRAAALAVLDDEADFEMDSVPSIKVPYVICVDDVKGRGLYATEFVPKGTVVWDGEYTALFEDAIDFRTFLAVLPDEYVCNLEEWCYILHDKEDDSHSVGCDLDDGSLINTAQNDIEYNVGHIPGKDKIFDKVRAIRDIQPGEEFLMKYEDFETETFAYFGM